MGMRLGGLIEGGAGIRMIMIEELGAAGAGAVGEEGDRVGEGV